MNFPVAAEPTSTALFPLTAAILLPPGDQARALTLPGKPKRKSLSSPVPILQESTVSLPSAAARCMLSEDHARASTLWPFVAKRAGTLSRERILFSAGKTASLGTMTRFPVFASQTCTELSSVPAEAMDCPCGDQATAVTDPVWPRYV